MRTLTERMNFSQVETANSIKVKKFHDVNHSETICLYCAENDIEINHVNEIEFNAAVEVFEDYGQNDKSTESFHFSIDND